MNYTQNIPRVGAGLLVAICLLSLSFVSCGGGSLTPNSSGPVSEPSTPAGSPTPPADGTGGAGGSTPNPPTGGGGTPTGNANAIVLSDLHQKDGWAGYALLRSDNYSICATCTPNGPKATWDLVQGVTLPSLSTNSSQFDIGGTEPFTDILWNNHLIGDLSSQNLHDSDKTLIPTLHNFVYDVHFFGADLPVSQAVEFDINQFFNGKSFIWGHECRIAGGHEWDTWDNAKEEWVPSGIPCNPKNNEWNHVVIEVQRTDDDRLLFKSITLNDEKSVLNRYDNPTPRKGWYGVTINYQQDGNRNQDAYSIWLDKLNFSYW
jgi:hypothetical protein